jgi:hypothetical protein
VPNLDAQQRLEVFQSLVNDDKIIDAFLDFLEFENNWKMNSKLQDLLEILTINFSAAATSELKEKLRIEMKMWRKLVFKMKLEIRTLVLNFKTLLETLKTIMLLPALLVQNVMKTILW